MNPLFEKLPMLEGNRPLHDFPSHDMKVFDQSTGLGENQRGQQSSAPGISSECHSTANLPTVRQILLRNLNWGMKSPIA